MSAKLEFFSTAAIALNMEVSKHPDLMYLLSNYEMSDTAGKLGEIAAYCNVVVDGVYTPVEIDGLCNILYRKLQIKRKVIIH